MIKGKDSSRFGELEVLTWSKGQTNDGMMKIERPNKRTGGDRIRSGRRKIHCETLRILGASAPISHIEVTSNKKPA